jgi:hypothetical protein
MVNVEQLTEPARFGEANDRGYPSHGVSELPALVGPSRQREHEGAQGGPA